MGDTHKISFPGLGIEEFSINEIALQIGSIAIRWYAVFICIGILLGYFYAIRRGKRSEGFTEDDIINLVLFVVPVSIIGARLLYVTTADDFFKGRSWTAVFEIWNGGLAIYGAIIFGALTILVFSKVTRLNVYKLLDCFAPAVMIGQIIGRWGNFMNGEAYGYSSNVDKLPWRMTVDGVVTHPTFLYESIWNVIGFIILNIVYKKKKYDGQIFAYYAIWYGSGRAMIELLRTDSLMGDKKLMSWFGAASVIIGVVVIVLRRKKGKFEEYELDEYVSKRVVTEGTQPIVDESHETHTTQTESEENNDDNT